MEWIRCEGHQRYHCVFAMHGDGAFHTWCGRRVEPVEVSRTTERPPARCAGCVSKLAHPYLVTKRMKDVLRGVA